MNNTLRFLFFTGILFIVYGVACRVMNWYFFWESRWVGEMMLLAGITGFFYNRVVEKEKYKLGALSEKIILVIVFLILLVQTVFLSVMPMTDAWQAVKTNLMNSQSLQEETGNIRGISMTPLGTYSKHSNNGESVTKAVFYITVKGDTKYKDMVIHLEHSGFGEWQITGAE